ncbi:MAG: hypothetical protein ABEJ88_02910 [Halobacterium sp.]
MRRRALLASLAAGAASLAGCTQSGGTAGTTTSTTDRTTTNSTTTTGEPDEPANLPEQYASVVDLETGPRTYAFAPTHRYTDDDANVALWFDRTGTADHPPVLRGWLENGNEYANTFDVHWIPAVGELHSRSPQGDDVAATLELAPTDAHDFATTVAELERDSRGFWRATELGPWVEERVRLDPGERVTLEYAVVGSPETTGRPTGTYRFRGDDRDARITVWDTASPGPEAESRFAGRDLPAFEGDQTVQWYHDADASTPVFVRPSTERLELDGRLQVTAVNHSRETARCGHWNLYKLVDGEWFSVGPWGHTADCRGLVPGETLTWSLRAFNGDVVACECEGLGMTRGYLGGGEYAVVAGYGHPADESAALVEFVGDRIRVTLTEGATVERDGGSVTVTSSKYGDGDDVPDATLTLTRTDGADERLIAEQVMQAGSGWFGPRLRGLRNALAPMETGVERVVVRTNARVAERAVGYDEQPRRFRFRGQAYELTADLPQE